MSELRAIRIEDKTKDASRLQLGAALLVSLARKLGSFTD